MKEDQKVENKDYNSTCFVIMPIGELEEYEDGHFKKIYEQIFKPAIENAGYTPNRVDDNISSHFIQASIIKDLIEAPMAICDLSTRNPNVLYELGIRHAFNKPVVLVQEVGTERIFDINGINTIDYRPNRLYDEVIEDREKIKRAIEETGKDTAGKRSLIKLLQINSAQYTKEIISGDDKTEIMLESILNEIKDVKKQNHRAKQKLPNINDNLIYNYKDKIDKKYLDYIKYEYDIDFDENNNDKLE